MATKRATSEPSSVAKKRSQVTVVTFKKWQSQYEREHQVLSWLRCDTDEENHRVVDRLWCKLYKKHEHNIQGWKNFSRAWIASAPSSEQLAESDSETNQFVYSILCLYYKKHWLLQWLLKIILNGNYEY